MILHGNCKGRKLELRSHTHGMDILLTKVSIYQRSNQKSQIEGQKIC
jgi:hypothetical protein